VLSRCCGTVTAGDVEIVHIVLSVMLQVGAGRTGAAETSAGESDGRHQTEEA